jgi:acyl-CoA thioesterase FadM
VRKLGAVNDANYCNYMERKLRAWYRRFPLKQAAAAADVAAEIAAPAEAEGSAPAADAAVESLLMSDGE